MSLEKMIVPVTSFTHRKRTSCHHCHTDPCSIPWHHCSPCPHKAIACPSGTQPVLPRTRKRSTKMLLARATAQRLILSLGLYLPSRSPSLRGDAPWELCAHSPIELHLPLALKVCRGSCADSSLQSSEDFKKAAKCSALLRKFPFRFKSTKCLY